MEFKIDTKDTYTVITPLISTIDAKLTDAIYEKCDISGQIGSSNYIIDLRQCQEIADDAFKGLKKLHEYCYNNSRSLVFTGINAVLLKTLKENGTDKLINIALTMLEAIDIISMEILERDLYNEES